MSLLLVLAGLAIVARIFWGLVHSPFTPWLLLEWPVAVYLAALSVICIWDLIVAPKRSKTNAGRWR